MNHVLTKFENVPASLQVHEGIMVPKASDFEYEGHKLIIFEDLFDELCDNLGISKFFTFLSRKCCVSTILTAQNPYAPRLR